MQVFRRFWLLSLFVLMPEIHAADQVEELRDPTQPLGFVAQKAAQAKLELQAVFVRGDKREAIVSGKSVGVGDRVGGAIVLSINDKSVVYSRNGKKETLYLRDSVMGMK